MEEFVDAVTGGAIWGIGFGLALGAVQAVAHGARPAARGTMRGALGLGDWVRSATAGTRETLEDIYHEARAEIDTERPQPETPEPEAVAPA
jgi:hypothetical protein